MDFNKKLEKIREAGHLRTLTDIHSIEGKFITSTRGRYINFTSNDYLGLAQEQEYLPVHPQNHMDLASSRLVSGNSILYTTIERRMSEMFGFEAALVTNSGYDANLALFNIFKGESVVAFSDEDNHASIIDGLRLSDISKEIYSHLDYDMLEAKLQQHPNSTKLICTDTVFSTTGDMVDVERLRKLKQKYPQTLIMIDDSHGLGLGLIEDYRDIDMLTASLSKGIGAYGGVILCNNTVKQLILNLGRPVIYSSSMPNSQLTHILLNLDLVQKADDNRAHVKYLSQYFNHLLEAHTGRKNDALSPIKFIEYESQIKAESTYEKLLEAGIWVSYFRYPTVQKPTLRLSLNYYHSAEDLEVIFKYLNLISEGGTERV
ncbi:pyridoxal phosphate-dependent aminotransferase family protein [Staphylococcus sp. SQ8-PEA]|uniref:Pyridoxal phosphate-dependent aminotransferase family protein n=1 Tax=Staphylococcus marylandisciuri TaxID=2981529 RepID=A0ABT2QQP0_9STAP|nr:pyridoxal phosphate-dependent aminotransferase family protein [Staphylococcus marylandisciuri]MCU5746305.1 pyridoxal phosphate-dependent aminotransferase family protein [Staphylococcus marylandisciuri]